MLLRQLRTQMVGSEERADPHLNPVVAWITWTQYRLNVQKIKGNPWNFNSTSFTLSAIIFYGQNTSTSVEPNLAGTCRKT